MSKENTTFPIYHNDTVLQQPHIYVGSAAKSRFFVTGYMHSLPTSRETLLLTSTPDVLYFFHFMPTRFPLLNWETST